MASLVVTADIRQPDDCENLINQAVTRFGALDYLIANAGVSMWTKFEDIKDLSLFRNLMETNYLGTVHCSHYALPHLSQSKRMIIAISSIQEKIWVPLHTSYIASKNCR